MARGLRLRGVNSGVFAGLSGIFEKQENAVATYTLVFGRLL